MTNFILNLGLLLILAIFQVSFLSVLPLPINSFNLILSLVVFVTIIISYQKGLWWALGGGLFLEFYRASFFGLATISLILTVIIINFLFNNLFTNRSLYTLLILGFFATICESVLAVILSLILTIFGWPITFLEFHFWQNLVWQPILNLLMLIIIFFIYQYSVGKIRNVFLPFDYYESKNKN
ncbi:MAG TPA: hypothetical protein VJG65_00930 [Patescibacteria group bacterium]|nr:hypothetical protein [Patescibacteria group bacterium]